MAAFYDFSMAILPHVREPLRISQGNISRTGLQEGMNMEKDLIDYTYLSDNSRYADLFNGVLFGGEEILAGERLKGEDTKLVMSSGERKMDDIEMW